MSKRLEMIEAMLAKGTTDPFHHYARAMELRSLERKDDALAAFADVRAKFPDYVPSYHMAAQVAIELGRNDVAREWLAAGLAAAERARDAHAKSEMTALLESLD
jgi:predicted Zn-dependent protease